MYSELQPGRILETISTLERRIQERFPGSGLGRVSRELVRVAEESEALGRRQGRPIWPLRLLATTGILGVLGITVGLMVLGRRVSGRVEGLAEWLQATESAVNEIILLSIAIYFLLSLETRVKRRTALRALHRLRSVVHIVDMHQLTKDPESVLSPSQPTESSPQRALNRFELARYLDYCSELLSLASKLSALHVQYLNDPVVLNAVNDIETLAGNLSSKIWQKIMILDIAAPEAIAPSPDADP